MPEDPRVVIRNLIAEAKRAGNRRLEQALGSVLEHVETLIASAEREAEAKANTLLNDARQEVERMLAEAKAKVEGILPKKEVEGKPSEAARAEAHAQDGHYTLVCEPTDTLVIYCSDHRFQQAFGDFGKDCIRPNKNFDLIAFPGATQMLAFGETMPKLTNALLRPIKFLVEYHGIKRIVIIAHEDCGWYANFVPQFFNIIGSMRDRQEKDMEHARRVLKELFPGVAVDLYYASIEPEDRIKIEVAH